ncbi:MAG: acyl carrier protein [Roseivirga sp.]|uniref:acyl carrier protein n=1 Tax=Roseivirga sp. TaxID=1964215 RepID=UPI001B220682|nr:acyl carrier protein [Roseivirga sp.]MBO6660502.1 acyl carrier protein [Roseivirga sp.]MBO6761956.1 acyl carrier protein [Roseivirga sp.]MBO6906761.1 acyl carrier protein [Roseivirga sp.]
MSVEQIVSEVFEVPLTEINDEKTLQGFESWDSMTHMMLITTLEDSLNIRFEGEEIITVETIGQLKGLVALKSA